MADKDQSSAQQRVYLAPGVYRRGQPVEQRDIRLVRTDVAGFIGYAERGPLRPPEVPEPDAQQLVVKVSSWAEFRAIFGGFIPYGCLAYSVRAFFENGGTTCYVIRVAATDHKDTSQRPRAASFALPSDLPRVSTAPEVLAKDGERNDLNVVIATPDLIEEGELVELLGAGVSEFGQVVNKNDGQVGLARRLAAPLKKGETSLVKYKPAIIVSATSSGNWGNRIRLTITPLTAGSAVEEFALRVTLEPGLDRTQATEEEFYHRISLDKESPFHAPDRVNGFSKLIRIEVAAARLLVGEGPLALPKGDQNGFNQAQPGLGLRSVRLIGGQDALSGVSVQDFTGALADLRGLRLFEEVDQVAILCAPEVVFEQPPVLPKPPILPQDPCGPPQPPPQPDPIAEDVTAKPPSFDKSEVLEIYRVMIDQCERLRDRVVILDTPLLERSPGQLKTWRDLFTTRFGAIYYPWLTVPDSLGLSGSSRRIPPSGHVAGIYARIDNQFGVHRPPANAPLKYVIDVVEEVTSLQQEQLNPFGINAIRAFPGRGIRVWGARSLAGPGDSDWRFIHVRRLMSMIEESVEDSTQWAVFEPNDDALRRTIVHSLSVFLETIWRQGGLKGAVAAEGFYVKCDETNNPRAVVESGQLVCQVGIAIAAPMEFLVFELRQQPGGAQLFEP
jgi:uncharacterized protein